MISGMILLQITETAEAITSAGTQYDELPILDLVLRGGWIMGIIGLLSVVVSTARLS